MKCEAESGKEMGCVRGRRELGCGRERRNEEERQGEVRERDAKGRRNAVKCRIIFQESSLHGVDLLTLFAHKLVQTRAAPNSGLIALRRVKLPRRLMHN